MTPKLKRVIRLDSTPLVRASLTEEGYLMDRPILTTVGIFEYRNGDGSIRRELRLPEEVFDPESLASYKGKPIIITHDAGLVDKDNVAQEGIGTILTEGYRDGDNVRAEIVIQDTNAQKDCGLKELSLGYNLDLDETPGEWHGEHYDAIQRNIRVNHLALVRLARAGDQARLNIYGRDNKTLKGGNKSMAKPKKAAKRADGATLNPEDFQKAIDAYKARRAERMQQKDSETETAAAPAAEDTMVAQNTAVTNETTENPETPAVAKDSEAVVCPHCKERTRRKYARGPHIKSLDRMENSPRVFFIDRIMTDGWFGCMQFRTVKQLIKAGRFYEAIPIVEVPKKWRE